MLATWLQRTLRRLLGFQPQEFLLTQAELEQFNDRWLNARLPGLVNAQSKPNSGHLWTEAELEQFIDRWLSEKLAAPVNAESHPHTDQLWRQLRDLENVRLNIKFLGYELARTLSAALPARTGLSAHAVGLTSKPSTQRDLESDWAAYWLQELKLTHVFHRKLWELVYVLQAIYEGGTYALERVGWDSAVVKNRSPATWPVAVSTSRRPTYRWKMPNPRPGLTLASTCRTPTRPIRLIC